MFYTERNGNRVLGGSDDISILLYTHVLYEGEDGIGYIEYSYSAVLRYWQMFSASQ